MRERKEKEEREKGRESIEIKKEEGEKEEK